MLKVIVVSLAAAVLILVAYKHLYQPATNLTAAPAAPTETSPDGFAMTSAHVCYDSKLNNVSLELLAQLVKKETSWNVTQTQWRGLGMTIPQLLVHTSIPFLIQIEDDPEWVPEENKEFGKWAKLDEDSPLSKKLAKSNARLAIQATTSNKINIDGKTIKIEASGTAVDPKNPEIAKVLAIICSQIDGVISDAVNGGVSECK